MRLYILKNTKEGAKNSPSPTRKNQGGDFVSTLILVQIPYKQELEFKCRRQRPEHIILLTAQDIATFEECTLTKSGIHFELGELEPNIQADEILRIIGETTFVVTMTSIITCPTEKYRSTLFCQRRDWLTILF